MLRVSEIVGTLAADREAIERELVLPWRMPAGTPGVWDHPALRAALELPAPEVLSLAEELFCKEWSLHCMALYVIGRTRHPDLVPLAGDHLLSGPVPVRAMSAWALAQIGGDDAVDCLLEVRDAEHPEVKRMVVDAFHSIASDRSIPVLARWVGRAEEGDGFRLRILRCFEHLADDAAMPALVRVISDETASDPVRGQAASAMARVGGREALSCVTDQLRSERPGVRRLCAEALARFRDPDPWPTVHRVLRTGPAIARADLIAAFAPMSPPPILRELARLAEDADVAVRRVVCLVLERLGDPESEAALQRALDDLDPTVQVRALESLGRRHGVDHLQGWAPADVITNERHRRACLQRARPATAPIADQAADQADGS
jgi:HEAT repeat protein